MDTAASGEAPPIWLILVLFPIAMGIMLTLVGHILALVGGWRALAAAYPATEEPPGERFYWRSLKLGWVGYNNCVNLIAGRFGLHVAVVLFLRIGHPPFYLPWSEIEIVPRQGWIFKYLEFRARKVPQVPIQILRHQAEPILRAAGIEPPS